MCAKLSFIHSRVETYVGDTEKIFFISSRWDFILRSLCLRVGASQCLWILSFSSSTSGIVAQFILVISCLLFFIACGYLRTIDVSWANFTRNFIPIETENKLYNSEQSNVFGILFQVFGARTSSNNGLLDVVDRKEEGITLRSSCR